MGRQDRFFVPTTEAFLAATAPWLVPLHLEDGTLHESIYFDDDRLSLGPDDRASIRRRLTPGAPEGPAEALYTLDLPKRLRGRAPGHGEILSLAAATTALRRIFGRERLAPYGRVRFRRLRYGVPDVGRIVIDTDVEHHSLLEAFTAGGDPVLLGKEPHPRVQLELTRRPGPRLLAALASVPRLPDMPKRWMGYFYAERAIKAALARRSELPGFEYEIKLDAEHLEVDPSCLPFPIFRVFQSQCVRRYYDGYRVSFRLARATMTRKGSVELVDGVPRRAEEKQKELSAWDLPPTELEMRRIKKTYLLLNPATNRTYNLCLDRCRHGAAKDDMSQIEIEYIGTLGLDVAPSQATRAVEAEVLADLRAIRDALIARHGFRITGATKRDWVKRQRAA